MRISIILVFFCFLLACKKDKTTPATICQPNLPEHNALIQSEIFSGIAFGSFRCLEPSPDGNLFYSMYSTDNSSSVIDYYTVLISGDSISTIDTSKFIDNDFRFEIGLLTESGYKKKNRYLPKYFYPSQILPIKEGPRKGEALVTGYFFNLWDTPKDYTSHIYLYNPYAGSLIDLYTPPNDPLGFKQVNLVFRQETNLHYEYYLKEKSNIALFQIDKETDNIISTVIGESSMTGNSYMELSREGDAEFIFLANNINSGNGYLSSSNLYKIIIENGIVTTTVPLILSGGNTGRKKMAVDKDAVYFMGSMPDKSITFHGNQAATVYTTATPAFWTFPVDALTQSEANFEYVMPSNSLLCSADVEALVNNEIEDVLFPDNSGNVLSTNTHVYSFGSYSNKTYKIKVDGKINTYPIGNAFVMSYNKQTKTTKVFSFGDPTDTSEFLCGAVIGNYLALGGQKNNSPWFVKIALSDL